MQFHDFILNLESQADEIHVRPPLPPGETMTRQDREIAAADEAERDALRLTAIQMKLGVHWRGNLLAQVNQYQIKTELMRGTTRDVYLSALYLSLKENYALAVKEFGQ